ncbi:MAG: hypothetical protein HY820_30090 [Acidobacteria bacterium]|nr:hypothetical protein [Acidobacteriota bacterium]
MLRFRILAAALMIVAAGCSRAPQAVNEVVSLRVSKIPDTPPDAVWSNAPEHTAKLLLQDLVEPRLAKASTPEVKVRSVTNGSEIAFRLTWPDAVVNDVPEPGRFPDGCAVQIPRVREVDPPEPQMGQSSRPVDITFWRADWQASVNGRPDNIRSIYPNAAVDHYPFEAKSLEPGSAAQREMATRYSPAAASGNRRAGPRDVPVEDLVAEGPGTLSPRPGAGSRGKGEHGAAGWSVVIVRKSPQGLDVRTRTQIAFAVWEGSKQETGARKMRTGWIPLSVREAK